MAKRVEVRRHSIKDGDAQRRTIGPLGVEFARLVGERQLRGKGFNRFFVSPMERTRQTLNAMAEGAGDFGDLHFAATIPDIYLFWEELKPMWKHCHLTETAGGDMVEAAWSLDGGVLAARAQLEYVRLFQEFMDELPDGTNALLIGHSPHLELLAERIGGMDGMDGLRECEGFAILSGSEHRTDGRLCSECDLDGDLRMVFIRTQFDLKHRSQKLP